MMSRKEVHNDGAVTAAMSAWSQRGRIATLADVPKTVLAAERLYRKNLGKALIQLRAINGQKSAAWLAEQVGRSEAAISRWETGKATPSSYDLRRIAEAFALRPEHFDLLLFPPEGPVSPVAERLAASAATGLRKGLVQLVPQRAVE